MLFLEIVMTESTHNVKLKEDKQGNLENFTSYFHHTKKYYVTSYHFYGLIRVGCLLSNILKVIQL